EHRAGLACDRRSVEEMRAERLTGLVVEVVLRQLGEDRDETRMRDDTCERIALETGRRCNPFRREDGRGRAHARKLQGHPEAVARPANGLALDGRVGQRLEE